MVMGMRQQADNCMEKAGKPGERGEDLSSLVRVFPINYKELRF